ncbi:MAG: SBBP repeat-containing protein [Bacteroidetes bacterium]|nr:SBBP repeat-containing protein [Bacteroidota bacterium]
MKRNYFTLTNFSIIILTIVTPLIVWGQPYCQWTKGYGLAKDEQSRGISVDNNGNVYSVGHFSSPTITFGSTTLVNVSSTGTSDVFIVKHDSCGNVVWAKHAGDQNYDDRGTAIITDKSGNVYLTGAYYSYYIKFGTDSLSNNGTGWSTYLVKLNSAGTVIWAKGLDASGSVYPSDLAIDKNGDIYMSGYYLSDSVKFGGIKITGNTSDYSSFLAKFSSSGNAISVKSITGYGNNQINSIATDTTGNVIIAGYYSDSLKVDSQILNGQPNLNMFFAKFNPAGTLSWAKSVGDNYNDEATGVTTDKAGNIYLTGYFQSDSVTFDNIKLVLIKFTSWGNGFLAKYDGAGNALWAKRIGGLTDDYGKSVVINKNGDVFVGGRFKSTSITIDGITLNNITGTNTTSDIFLAKYNSNGQLKWAKSAGGPGDDAIDKLALGTNGIPYITGTFKSVSIAFGANTLNNGGLTDIFISNDITRNGMLVPQLCTVTVDSLSKNNVIFWDKTPYMGVKHFIAYRETSSNLYSPLGTIPYDSLSYYTDTVRTKYAPNTGNPNAGTYRYKLQFMDTSGNYSYLSPYHNTIFIVDNGLGQFTWNPLYTIEGSANPVSNYLLMRDNNGTGIWTVANSVTGSQNTVAEPSYSSYINGKWRVETQWSITCTATFSKKSSGKNDDMSVLTTKTINNSRSNIKDNIAVVGVTETNASTLVSVYPNPANDKLNIEWPELSANQPAQILLRNQLGMEVIKFVPEKNQSRTTLDISGIAPGIYCVEIKGNKYTALKKLMVD